MYAREVSDIPPGSKMTIHYRGLTSIKEIDETIFSYLSAQDLAICREISKHLNWLATHFFGKIVPRDFKRYLEQKIVDKPTPELTFSDYKALFLFRKKLIASNRKQEIYSKGPIELINDPLFFKLFGKKPSQRQSYYKDLCVFCLGKTKNDPLGKIVVIKLDDSLYQFDAPLIPHFILPCKFTTFLIHTKKIECKFQRRIYDSIYLYDLRSGEKIESFSDIIQDDDLSCLHYWLSDDHLIVNNRNRNLDKISPLGKVNRFFECPDGYEISGRSTLDNDSFFITVKSTRPVSFLKNFEELLNPELTVFVYHKNQIHCIFNERAESLRRNDPFCGFLKNGSFWAHTTNVKNAKGEQIFVHPPPSSIHVSENRYQWEGYILKDYSVTQFEFLSTISKLNFPSIHSIIEYLYSIPLNTVMKIYAEYLRLESQKTNEKIKNQNEISYESCTEWMETTLHTILTKLPEYFCEIIQNVCKDENFKKILTGLDQKKFLT